MKNKKKHYQVYSTTNTREHQAAQKKKDNRQKNIKRVLIVVLCLFLIGVGYTGMDAYMTRHAVPAENISLAKKQNSYLSEITLSLKAKRIDSISLDGSIMLDSIIEETHTNGFNSIVFDAKRSDGTIGYQSTLASVDTYSAISSASSNPKASTKKLLENDILPVARISCYKDNVVPSQNTSMALMIEDRFYTYDDNTYLNPNNDDVYCYIRDIIRELNTYGITVFVLSDCDLPEELGNGYKDGFDTISKRLTNELGTGIKLMEEKNVKLTGIEPSNGKITNKRIKKEISNFKKLGDNQIYNVSSELDSKRICQLLNESNVSSYIIGE